MATDTGDKSPNESPNESVDENEKLFFNGIDAATGQYLFDPMTTAQLADVAKGKTLDSKKNDKETLSELKFRSDHKGEAHFGVKEGIDATKLEQTGWGVIFAAVAAGSDEEKEQCGATNHRVHGRLRVNVKRRVEHRRLQPVRLI